MEKGDRLVFATMLLLSAGFAGAAGVSVYKQKQAEHIILAKQVLHVPLAEVIGSHPNFQGDPHSPYTLVEFGDYQCPPCHAANEHIPALLKKYQGRVRFTFRNLPLTSIHYYALSAALAAESARKHGQFWPMHDRLYQIDPNNFDNSAIRSAVNAQRLNQNFRSDMKTAKVAVDVDLHDAKLLGLNSTPSFVLCGPTGQIALLRNLNQLDDFVHM